MRHQRTKRRNQHLRLSHASQSPRGAGSQVRTVDWQNLSSSMEKPTGRRLLRRLAPGTTFNASSVGRRCGAFPSSDAPHSLYEHEILKSLERKTLVQSSAIWYEAITSKRVVCFFLLYFRVSSYCVSRRDCSVVAGAKPSD